MNSQWNQLIEYLNENGWLQCPGSWAMQRDEWRYVWLLPDITGTLYSILGRRKYREPVNQDNMEFFLIQKPEQGLEIAAKLSAGEHLPSPPPDPASGRKIAWL